jgi:5-methylcytosine-specific restriction enzyme A
MQPCSYPSCGALVQRDSYNRGKCPKHRIQVQREYDQTRPDHLVKFYNSAAWRNLRADVARREPLCRLCQEQGRVTAGQQIDHIESVKENWARRLDPTNLRNLCLSCHRSVTRKNETSGGMFRN